MKILLVEDNPDHAELIQAHLEQSYQDTLTCDWSQYLGAGLTLLAQQTYELFLCDLKLPDSSTEETLACLQGLYTKTPIIVLTSHHDEDMARQLIGQGVQDFLPKDQLDPGVMLRVCNHSIERKKLLVRLEEKHREQEQFCYSLCHDFKEPIRRLGTATSILESEFQQQLEFNENQRWCFDSMNRSIQNLNSITNCLYDYLKLTKASFSPVSLKKLVENVQDEWAEDQVVDIYMGTLPVIEGNEAQLLLMLKNLLDNAIKYNTQRPEIFVDAHLDHAANRCLLSIRDNGIGMEPEYIQRALQPFKRLVTRQQYPGSGLGLSIVSRIIENHGGDLHIESQLDVGTEVKVSLPIRQAESELASSG